MTERRKTGSTSDVIQRPDVSTLPKLGESLQAIEFMGPTETD